jgi:benzoyl-CoA reductase/2-hydroxyglutaryl-CoA dehydratase subunit BcrC/BadD/HgdB
MYAEITCSYVPLEIFSAAGLVPRRLLPPPARETGLLPSNFCSYARACLFSRGDAPVVFTSCCDALRRCFDVRKAAGDAVFILDLPRQASGEGILRYSDELKKMARWLQSLGAASPFSEEKLIEAIQIYRRIRAKLTELKKLSGRAESTYRTLLEVFSVSPEKALLSLGEMVRGAGKKNPGGKGTLPKGVLVAGTILPDPEVFFFFEESGASVIYADFCLEERLFLDAAPRRSLPGPERTEETGAFLSDPWLFLAREYLEKPPCPRMIGKNSRRRFIESILESIQPAGVVFYGLKFCDHGLYDVPLWRNLCTKKGIPFLHLEGEYRSGVPAQLGTRIQAFLETL